MIMETDKICPRCKEGKIVEKVSNEMELDEKFSLMMGVGLFPIRKEVTYVIYSCSGNCGYKEKIKQ